MDIWEIPLQCGDNERVCVLVGENCNFAAQRVNVLLLHAAAAGEEPAKTEAIVLTRIAFPNVFKHILKFFGVGVFQPNRLCHLFLSLRCWDIQVFDELRDEVEVALRGS